MKTIEKLIAALEKTAKNTSYSEAVRNSAKQNADGYRRVLKLREEQKAKRETNPVEVEMYETLVQLHAETQGFLNQSQDARDRALNTIARFEGR